MALSAVIKNFYFCALKFLTNFQLFYRNEALKYLNDIACTSDYQCKANAGLICENVCT